jgi:CHAT domain-containing protein
LADFDGAAAAAASAAAYFHRAQGGYARWAPIYQAVADRMAGRIPQALARLDQAQRKPLPSGFRHMRGRLAWTSAVCHESEGKLDVAREEFREAVRLFEESGETGHEMLMRTMLAEDLGEFGDYAEAWQHQGRALAWMEGATGRTRPDMVLHTAAFLALAQEQREAALHFENALVSLDEGRAEPLRRAEARLQRANTLITLRRWPEAERDLRAAGRALTAAPDGGYRDRVRAEIEASRALLFEAGPERAIASANAALDYFSAAGHPLRRVRLLITRARAHRARGQIDDAASDLEAAIHQFEEQRIQLAAADDRSMSFEDGRAAFTDMIALQATVLGQPDRALRYAERSRRWAMPSTAEHEPPLDPCTVTGRIPPGTAFFHYVVVDDRVLVWGLSQRGVRFFERRVTRSQLESMVAGFREAVANGGSDRDIADRSASLWDILFPGSPQSLEGVKRLVMLLDGPLYGVPLPALKAPFGGYLAEHTAIETAPSFAMALQDRPFHVPESILAVGDAHVPSDSLPRLISADAEAKEVAQAYPKGQVVTGAGATPGALLAQMPRYEVLHFAGHSVASVERPWFSRLLLAPDPSVPGDTGSLYARDLMGLRFPKAEVVVLASCATARGRVVAGEGPLNMARPFLAAGARHVVASLWDVDDIASTSFLRRFHRELRGGASCARALQSAQVEAIRGGPAFAAPAAWAGFVTFGGGDLEERPKEGS